jgi:polar amino acid transport system substrate-binding protein
VWSPASAQSTGDGDGDGEPIVVGTKSIAPFVLDDTATPEGFSIDLMDAVAERAGIDVEYRSYETVAQLVDAVEAEEIDAATAAISITAEREQRVDFSSPIFEAGLQILARPSSDGGVGSAIGELLSSTAARFIGFLVAVMVVAGIAMFVADRFDDDRKYTSIFDAIWMAAVNLVTVGYGDQAPKRAISKLIAVVWMLFGLFIGAQFTAVLSSSLTVQSLQAAIDGPDDLQGKSIATVGGTTSESWLIGEGFAPIPSETIEDAVTMLKDRTVDAIVFDSPVLRDIANRDDSVVLAGPRFRPEFYGIAVAEGSSPRERFDAALLALREDGTYDRLVERWFGTA